MCFFIDFVIVNLFSRDFGIVYLFLGILEVAEGQVYFRARAPIRRSEGKEKHVLDNSKL